MGVRGRLGGAKKKYDRVEVGETHKIHSEMKLFYTIIK